MSIKVMTRVWEKSEQKGAPLLLTLALADNANDDGICWPGDKYLSKKIRMSERQTQRLIDGLVLTGEIYKRDVEVQGRGYKPHYAVLTGLSKDEIAETLENNFGLEVSQSETIADAILKLRVESFQKKGDKLSKKGDKLSKKGDKLSKKGDIFEGEKSGDSPDGDGANASDPEVATVLTVIEPSYRSIAASPRLPPQISDLADDDFYITIPDRALILRVPILPGHIPAGYTAIEGKVIKAKESFQSFKLVLAVPPKEKGSAEKEKVVEPVALIDYPEPKAPKTQDHVALIEAWHYSIPDDLRPIGKPVIERNCPVAMELKEAGATPWDVVRFVTCTYSTYQDWAVRNHAPLVMTLEHVKKFLPSFKVKESANGPKHTATQSRASGNGETGASVGTAGKATAVTAKADSGISQESRTALIESLNRNRQRSLSDVLGNGRGDKERSA